MGWLAAIVIGSLIASTFGEYYRTKKQFAGQTEAAQLAARGAVEKQQKGITEARRVRREESAKQSRLRRDVARSKRIADKRERKLAVQIGNMTGASVSRSQYAAVALSELSRAMSEGVI